MLTQGVIQMKEYRGFIIGLFGGGVILFAYGLVYFFGISSSIMVLAGLIAFFMGITGFVIHAKEFFRELSKRANKDKSQN